MNRAASSISSRLIEVRARFADFDCPSASLMQPGLLSSFTPDPPIRHDAVNGRAQRAHRRKPAVTK
jgi:hypothetical protein